VSVQVDAIFLALMRQKYIFAAVVLNIVPRVFQAINSSFHYSYNLLCMTLIKLRMSIYDIRGSIKLEMTGA